MLTIAWHRFFGVNLFENTGVLAVADADHAQHNPTHFIFHSLIATMSYCYKKILKVLVKDWAAIS